MGRPKGDAARTKSRPSSSSLAASLLPTGATAVGFGGYVGSSRVDTAGPVDDSVPFQDIDGEIAQHLKRLARKDPTTKIKALYSLSELLKQKTTNEIVPIISQWAFEYKKLLLDYNREVRRATHDTMTIIVSILGRDLAPYLKSLMGPWWFSQFDSCHEVSQAAKRSFQTAFPVPEKRLEALIHCTNEIFVYLEENLKLTPQRMSEKAVASDELEEMHQQVISASLLALATLIDVLVCPQSERPGFESMKEEPKHFSKARATAVACAEKMFSGHKFFMDFMKSKSTAIRSAAYSALRSFIKNLPHAISGGDVKTLAVTVFGTLQERDLSCHSSMWDMVLWFCRKFPGSWTTINIQKTVLNRLWHFLKNGCFGSQKISYPALIVLIDAMPPKLLGGEKFFFEFFQSLWAGRSFSQTFISDRVAFFLAVKECFLWALKNASRFFDGNDDVCKFQRTLVDEILSQLLWNEYLSLVESENIIEVRETVSIKPPVGYVEDLGRCIIEILSGIDSLGSDILMLFSSKFQTNCSDFFQQTSSSTGSIDQIIKFLLLMDHHAVRKGETWPLAHLVGPTLEKNFPLIVTLDSEKAVMFLVVSVDIFGARKITQALVGCELETQNFLQAFTGKFIPWCLQRSKSSTYARMDLLLALLDEECFQIQWSSIITYAIKEDNVGISSKGLGSDFTSMLAMLMEKARSKIREKVYLQESYPDCWHHELLDSAALCVARSSPTTTRTSDAQFLCAVLGGSTTDDTNSFLSRKTILLVYKDLLLKLMSFMLDSTSLWVKDVCSLLRTEVNDDDRLIPSQIDAVDMAHFAIEVLEGSFFCLKAFDGESELVPCIIGAVCVIDWELKLGNDFNDSGDKLMRNAGLAFYEPVHALRKLVGSCIKNLSVRSRQLLRSILVQSVRYMIFKEDKLDAEIITSFCCSSILEILDGVLLNQLEEQDLLDQLLGKDSIWPLYLVPGSPASSTISDIENSSKEQGRKFVRLVDKLILEIGFGRVVGDAVDRGSSVAPPMSVHQNSRAWLAAEILCTWEWPGGSALSSFLPALTNYVKELTSQDGLLDPLINMLLDGALLNSTIDELSLPYVCPTSYDTVERIKEPYLRALVSLMHTLFKNCIWGKGEALVYFKLLVDKLYIGEVVNSSCLSIFPSIMNVLAKHLGDVYGEFNANGQLGSIEIGEVHANILDWLNQTLLFPPLNAWQTGKDMGEWLQVVISCYPVLTTTDVRGLKPERSISPSEKSLVLQLFRKQRHNLSVVNKLQVAQKLLSELLLVTVAYCWEEFNEDDWEFALYRLRWWIDSAVVVMEDVAENVNNAAGVSSTFSDSKVIVEKLKQVILEVDAFTIDLARNALLIFSMFRNLVGHDRENAENLNSLKSEKWDTMKERVLESILRLFFSSGITEAIASCYCHDASLVVASSRFSHAQFWELVALSVADSSTYARDKAIKSVEIWGLSKGPVEALYAVLFSVKPLARMRSAAFVLLSTEPISRLAFVNEDRHVSSEGDISSGQDPDRVDWSKEENLQLRGEISHLIGNLPNEVLEMDLLATERVNVYVAWALLLSHLISLPSSSPARERLVQYIQVSAKSTVLDCLLQHIPVECLALTSRKKDVELPATLSGAAKAAKHAIVACSVLFSVEALWPIETNKMASFAGAIFGLMLRILPAYVRGWFNDIRDRSLSSAIESFTKSWCSPPLIADELSQIKKADITDENFSVSVSKSANEVVATYTKDETGMDLVIRLPASYPLRHLDVDCTRSLGISDVKQRKWLLSMVSFVRNQNGALAEAIRMWKSNFDKEFEGVEECPICYSVIHTTNHSLPRLACKTCKHKFHSACLYKWFSTSHKSTCPLCQSPF
ncbi:hypothetical protein Leryth_002735 [Lithospermum erythrorhizon]|nr:hypothetical protein Leryth_002735 [Lithospermum erythrorhizon]